MSLETRQAGDNSGPDKMEDQERGTRRESSRSFGLITAPFRLCSHGIKQTTRVAFTALRPAHRRARRDRRAPVQEADGAAAQGEGPAPKNSWDRSVTGQHVP